MSLSSATIAAILSALLCGACVAFAQVAQTRHQNLFVDEIFKWPADGDHSRAEGHFER